MNQPYEKNSSHKTGLLGSSLMTFKFSYCLYSMWDIMSLNVGIGNSPLGMDCHIHIVDGMAAYNLLVPIK